LMYEYDVYADARQTLPRVREPLQAVDGEYYLVKTDILAHTMSFSSSKETMSNVVTIPTSRVREIIAMNRAGKRVESLLDKDSINEIEEPTYRTEEDSITRFDNQNRRRKGRNNRGRNNRNGNNNNGRMANNDNQAQADGRDNRENRDNNRDNRENRPNQEGESKEPRQGGQRNNRRDNNRMIRIGRFNRDGRDNNRNHRRDDNHRRDGNKADSQQQPKQE